MRFATILLLLEDFMLPCYTKKFIGIDCPGCGLQRSIALLLKGDFTAAFEMYPAIYPMLILLLFVTASTFVKIKFEMTIKIVLAISTGLFIIINYLFKINNLIH